MEHFSKTRHNTASVDVQTHKYNGKELDLMHGLNEYDYGARQYDPAIGQFTTVDPLCEKSYHISPYAYCGGNPVNKVDPDGKEGVSIIDDKNKTITIKAAYYVETAGRYSDINITGRKICGGYTDKDIKIMNEDKDTKLNRWHEMFHTFGLNDVPNPDKVNGIMRYGNTGPQKPNQGDANNLIYNSYMRQRRVKK